jgi:glycosyltransferase involved in cell wall biosynthesis
VVPIEVNVDRAIGRIWFEQTGLSRLVRRDRVDVLHSSGYTAPTMNACRTVMTVHDLCYLEIPEMIRNGQGRLRWLALRALGPRSMKGSDYLITDTHHVAAQIHQRYGVRSDRIHTLHLKPVRDFSKTDAVPVAMPERFGSGYLFYVGSWLPHKNHRVLLAAVSEAKRRRLDWPPLVLAGLHLNTDRQRADFQQTLLEYDIADCVFACPGGLSVEQLAGLYQRARLFVFPSLFEGFGYPVVEAMSAKVPVLCSHREPMLEVSDGHAMTFDPHDLMGLVDCIARLLVDEQARQELIQSGYRRYLQLCEQTQHNGEAVFRIYKEALARR